MKKEIFNRLKKFKYIYLHPHGIGDLIISMPYIKWLMEKNFNFSLCVKDNIYLSGFFKNFLFKDRIFPGCPSIYNKIQTIKNFRKIDEICHNFKEEGIEAFYLKFNKKENRRYQVWKGLSNKMDRDIPFDENIHGEIYLSEGEINLVSKRWGGDFCFFHTRSISFIKSVVPRRLKRYIEPNCSIFSPVRRDNININFAAQMMSKKNIVVDSVYMHSAGALKKDIDVLFVSMTVKGFISTLMPSNIRIHRIIYGDFYDIFTSFLYYEILSHINVTK
jgi:hypothetical protein